MFSEFLDQHDLKSLLLLPGSYHPFPLRTERDSWLSLDEGVRRQIIQLGDQALNGYPMLTATQFLSFVRTGSRKDYEDPYFSRRRLLAGAVLAECLKDDGTYMDAVVDGLWCICDEASWIISAHNDIHPTLTPAERALPDVSAPVIDLFAAQTAATLSLTLYFLEDKLDEVSPQISTRVRSLLNERILHPFLKRRDFSWMKPFTQKVNNWMPWILSNILMTALLIERDHTRMSQIVAYSLRLLDTYLDSMPEDGGCDEGAGYFNMAGNSLLDCLEAVYAATDGKASFYHEPLIRAIGEYPAKVHIAGPYFVNFADCDAQPLLDGASLWRYGQRTDNNALMALGASIHQAQLQEVTFHDTPQFNRLLELIFTEVPPCQPVEKPSFDTLPALQVFFWRRNRLYVAIKGGNNNESHNHNDIGSFIVYVDENPCIVDAGNMVYTAKTFGPERYTLFNTRSANHNLPLIGDIEQAPGEEYAAREVSADENGASLELAGAYPACACINSFRRTLRLEDNGLTLTDDIHLTKANNVTWVFMLREEPKLAPGEVTLGNLTMRHAKDLRQQIEKIPVTDARMARNYPGCFWKLTLTSPEGMEHRQSFQIEI